MITENNVEGILEIFIISPAKEFQHRELARIAGLGASATKRCLDFLRKKRLIIKKKGKIYDYYVANRENEDFKIIKILYTLLKLNKIIDFIARETRSNCIVLFGSAAKGEDTEKSDIDLFVQSKSKNVRLKSLFGRKVNLIFEPNIEKLSAEFLNSIANGIVLYGFLEVKK